MKFTFPISRSPCEGLADDVIAMAHTSGVCLLRVLLARAGPQVHGESETLRTAQRASHLQPCTNNIQRLDILRGKDTIYHLGVNSLTG